MLENRTMFDPSLASKKTACERVGSPPPRRAGHCTAGNASK
jgi:hypothetical protein